MIGEYLARMHFRLMDRPAYAIRRRDRATTVTAPQTAVSTSLKAAVTILRPHTIPFNRSSTLGKELQYIAETLSRRPDRRRSDFHETVRGAAGTTHRGAARAADHLMHACAGNGRAAAGTAAWRRSHRAVVHVRVDGQRVRPARRDARVRRHPARHPESGRGPRRAVDH